MKTISKKAVKCLTCGEELLGARISARDENGMSYVMCTSCGYVMRAHINKETGVITQLARTPETDCQEEMIKASRLFAEARVGVSAFKAGFHSEIQSMDKLKTKETEEREVCGCGNLCCGCEADCCDGCNHDELGTDEQMNELGENVDASKVPSPILSLISRMTGISVKDLLDKATVKRVNGEEVEEFVAPEYVVFKNGEDEDEIAQYAFAENKEDLEELLEKMDDNELLGVFELKAKSVKKKTVYTIE